MPHVVIKPEPDGSCNRVHVTDGLPFAALPAKPRGNTQAVLLPAPVTGLSRAVYLGIVHTEVERKYENYFYQMEVRQDGTCALPVQPLLTLLQFSWMTKTVLLLCFNMPNSRLWHTLCTR
jgi:hypothetical protein